MTFAPPENKNPRKCSNTLQGKKKPQYKGISKMSITHKSSPMQIGNSYIKIFPNEDQQRIPNSAKSLQEEFGVLPYHAKLIAQLQGYEMGGA